LIRVFIGFDARETVAFPVLSHSICSRSSLPVSVTPLMLPQLKGVLTRERHPLQSTDFSFSRFLTPFLCNFEGWALFLDCDMLARDDLAKLWALRDERFAVQVVKHAHVPLEQIKFLGEAQTKYQKKNWSSAMLLNNAKCRALTPEYVNNASGLELHQFKWLADDSLIGEIPRRWNHLVGYDAYDADAAIVHYTTGGPYFSRYQSCQYADEWFAERERMLFAGQIADATSATESAPDPARAYVSHTSVIHMNDLAASGASAA
jgi:lipopolysaccharide biosynthesis glycosyltransferase